jgi:hypothetical protein
MLAWRTFPTWCCVTEVHVHVVTVKQWILMHVAMLRQSAKHHVMACCDQFDISGGNARMVSCQDCESCQKNDTTAAIRTVALPTLHFVHS